MMSQVSECNMGLQDTIVCFPFFLSYVGRKYAKQLLSICALKALTLKIFKKLILNRLISTLP